MTNVSRCYKLLANRTQNSPKHIIIMPPIKKKKGVSQIILFSNKQIHHNVHQRFLNATKLFFFCFQHYIKLPHNMGKFCPFLAKISWILCILCLLDRVTLTSYNKVILGHFLRKHPKTLSYRIKIFSLFVVQTSYK